jgi:gluconokinase
MPESPAVVLVIMGVSGSGKSTVAELLASDLGWPFQEGDALHPKANVTKMAAGHALTDEDRAPWLERIADWVDARLDAGENGIITCSALKRAYRDLIDRRGSGVVFVYLAGSKGAIASQLSRRHGHFMPQTLLGSQLETLEEPTGDESAVRIELGGSPEELVTEILSRLRLTDAVGPTSPRSTP